MIQSSTKEIIFNPKTLTEINRLKRYLNQINKADRTGATENYSRWINEEGKHCYLLDSKRVDFFKSTPGKTCNIYTWDFLIQGEKENTFQLYSLQADFLQQYIMDGPEKEQWIQQQMKENPESKDEDWRYMGIYKSEIDKCCIYNGNEQYYEATYFHQKQKRQSLNSLSFLGEVYQQLKHETAFGPIKNIFFNRILPKTDQKVIAGCSQKQILANYRIQEGR